MPGRSRTEFPSLPSKPLATKIAGMALDQERQLDLYSPIRRQSNVEGQLVHYCKRAGVSARTVSRWSNGELPTVQFVTADKVLCNLGLLWFDIPEWADHPDAKLAFTGEKS